MCSAQCLRALTSYASPCRPKALPRNFALTFDFHRVRAAFTILLKLAFDDGGDNERGADKDGNEREAKVAPAKGAGLVRDLGNENRGAERDGD